MDNKNYGQGRNSHLVAGGASNCSDTLKRRSPGGNGKRYRRTKKHGLPIAVLIVLDVLAAALLLGIFYVTNYMIKVEVNPTDLPTPSATQTDTPTTTVDLSDWRTLFADKFTDGAVEQTDTSYKSANINITINTIKKYDVTCYVAEIYVADIKYFKTAFAKNADVMGDRELTDKVASENNAILAINGDHCVDNPGPVVRNGKIYRETKTSADIFVMNHDGSMEAFSPDVFDIETIKSEGAYQVWTFGPMLLTDGQPMTKFNSTVTGLNPRTAIGYFEPGHYCFVVVGGRMNGYDEGYTMDQLSQLMYDLGCKQAYNLDGGRSSEIIFLGKMLNQQASGRRSTTDILYIGEGE